MTTAVIVGLASLVVVTVAAPHAAADGRRHGGGDRARVHAPVVTRQHDVGSHRFSHRHFGHQHFGHRPFFRGPVVGFGVVAPPFVAYAPPSYYDPPVYAPPPPVYYPPVSAPPPPAYYPPVSVAPPPGNTLSLAPPPDVVQFANGRYELRGDGITTPYRWVWIPNPPPAPPADAPGQESAPPRARHSDLYRWTDEDGTVHWTDRLEAVPDRYRAKVTKSKS